MTDKELVVALAEKVMGWKTRTKLSVSSKEVIHAVLPDGGECRIWCPGNVMLHEDWTPLESIGDAMMVAEKARKDGYEVVITLHHRGDSCYVEKGWQDGRGAEEIGRLPRAICMAVARAYGILEKGKNL